MFAHSTPAWRRDCARVGALASLVVSASLAVLITAPAHAGAGASLNATINVGPPPVRSLTVTPGAVNYGECFEADGGSSTGDALSLPHGYCSARPEPPTNGVFASVVIENGAAPSEVDVDGANAAPSNGGTPWALCGASTSPCEEPGTSALPQPVSTTPGIDQYIEETDHPESAYGVALTQSPQCDLGFNVVPKPENEDESEGSCVAKVNQDGQEGLFIEGPEASTDDSSRFTTTITWTAVAP